MERKMKKQTIIGLATLVGLGGLAGINQLSDSPSRDKLVYQGKRFAQDPGDSYERLMLKRAAKKWAVCGDEEDPDSFVVQDKAGLDRAVFCYGNYGSELGIEYGHYGPRDFDQVFQVDSNGNVQEKENNPYGSGEGDKIPDLTFEAKPSGREMLCLRKYISLSEGTKRFKEGLRWDDKLEATGFPIIFHKVSGGCYYP
jgi:hypothetical protein